MADIVLTLKQIEDFFQALTIGILGYATADPRGKKINQDKVRLSWPSAGQPGFKITDDICFIRVTSKDDAIVQQRDKIYINNLVNLDRTIGYTRVHQVQWILYGPNSFDRADVLRQKIFDCFDALAEKNMYLITTLPTPSRAPELFNGQWWDRVDVTASFNEGVQRQDTVEVLSSSETFTTDGKIIIEES